LKKAASDFPQSELQGSLATSVVNLGQFLFSEGRFPESEELIRAAIALREKLVTESGLPGYRDELAQSYFVLGALLMRIGNDPAAEQEFRKALKVSEELVAEHPEEVAYRITLVSIHSAMGVFLAAMGQSDEAIEHLTRTRSINEFICNNFPPRPRHRLLLLISYNALAMQLVFLKRWDEARSECEKALNAASKLVERFPDDLAYQDQQAYTYTLLGRLAVGEGKPMDSLEWYGKAIQSYNHFRTLEPNVVEHKLMLGIVYADRAEANDQLQQYSEAADDWSKAIESSNPAEQIAYRARRAVAKVRSGSFDQGIADVKEVELNPNSTADALFNVACFYALACDTIPDKQQEYADHAMQCLEKAKQMGYKDGAHMAEDSDLKALREREDFQSLVAELAKSQQSEVPK
jgi:tetratricopeptide (TPR) repeat protein